MELSKRKIPWGLNLIKDLNILGWAIVLIFIGLDITMSNILPFDFFPPLLSLAMLSFVVSLLTSASAIIAVYKKSEYFWCATLYGTIINWFIPTSLDTLQVYLASPSTYIAIGVEALVLWYWFKMKPYFRPDFVFATDEKTQKIDSIFRKSFKYLIVISIVGGLLYFFVIIPHNVNKISTYLISHTDQENLEYCADVSESWKQNCYPVVFASLLEKSELNKQVCEAVPGEFDKNFCMLLLKDCESITNINLQQACKVEVESNKVKQE